MEKNLSAQEQFIKRLQLLVLIEEADPVVGETVHLVTFQLFVQTEEEPICVINSFPCPGAFL